MNKDHDRFFKARIGKDYNNPTEKWFIRDLQFWRFHVKTQWRFQNNLRKDHLIWEYCTAIQIFLIIVTSFYNICFICSNSCSLPIKSGIKSKNIQRNNWYSVSSWQKIPLWIGPVDIQLLRWTSYTITTIEDIEFLSYLKIHIGIQIYEKLEMCQHVNLRQVNSVVRILAVYVEFLFKKHQTLE